MQLKVKEFINIERELSPTVRLKLGHEAGGSTLFWKNDFRDEADPQKTNSRYPKVTYQSVSQTIPEKRRGGD